MSNTSTSSWSYCNTTLEDQNILEDPLWKNWKFHHFGLFLSGSFAIVSVIVSFFLVFQHATHYLKPFEQRHIIRILLMIPVYSCVSFLSYYFYHKAVYFEVLRDCYEAFAIASFFTLLCHYIAPTLHEQKDYFRSLKPINWFWGVFGLQACTGGQNKGPFRKPRSGLTWFNIVWIGVFQYCVVRVLFTIVSVVTQYLGFYCEASLSPLFAHVWTLAFEAASVTIAMFCIIQFYLQLRQDLAEHRPFLKVLCIKLVIFFSFWQTIVISLLSSSRGPLQPTRYLSYQDIKVGIPSVLLCIEMAIFSVMHLFAFPWKEYSIKHNNDPLTASGSGYSGEAPKYLGGPLGIKAMADAFNPWDIIKASARGFRWLFVGVRHRENDSSYQDPTNKLDGSSAYTGPSYANTGSAATELRPSVDNSRNRREENSTQLSEDDRAGLLRHSATPAGALPGTSPYHSNTAYRNDEYSAGDDSSHDLSATHHHRSTSAVRNPELYDAKPSDYDDVDPGYHPGIGPSGKHPALRSEDDDDDDRATGQPARQWDPWAGAQRNDAESVRPPTYRTNDPR